MRHLMCAVVLLISGLTSFAQAEQVVCEYSFAHPRMETVSIAQVNYDRVIMAGAATLGQAGQPALPSREARILLPHGSDVQSVEVLGDERILVGSGYHIEPAEQPIPLSWDLASMPETEPDPGIYTSSRPFPEQRSRSLGVQAFRGYRILILKLNPVEYIPATGQLYYYPHLRVVVTTAPAAGDVPLFRGLPVDELELSNRVDNASIAQTYMTAQTQGAANFDLLILTTPALASAFGPLKNFHDAAGLPTEIYTTADVGSIDPADVRAFIAERYLSDGIQYVLIGGDDQLIPARDMYCLLFASQDTIETNTMPSDVYFGCLDGTYNFDGDSRWGESTDGDGGGDVDLLAEVYVGRAPVDNATEVTRFVNKTIQYLTSSAPYLQNVLMLGEHLAFTGFGEYGGYSMDEIVDGADTHGFVTVGIPSLLYNVDRVYDLDWTGNYWPNTAVSARVNSGTHIVNHLGHCDYNWAMKFQSTDVLTQFANTEPCFIYSQGCNAGQFDYGDCWAEYATVKTDHAAFAVVMNSRFGLGARSTAGPNQLFNREFWDAVYNPDENKPQLGRANQDSKEDWLYTIDISGIRWCYYDITLFADPTVAFKSVAGISFEFPQGVPNSLAPGEALSFPLVVKPVGAGVPVPGSGQLHCAVDGGSFAVVAIVETSPNEYEVTLPAVSCGEQFAFFVSAEEASNGRFCSPDSSTPHTATIMTEEIVVFADDFESDLGWTVSGGLWARGVPTGGGGEEQRYGGEDPSDGFEGPSIYGYNLSGNYEHGIPAMHLTSPAIDCSTLDNVHLKYWRWLGVEQPIYDRATVAVSIDGAAWTPVWENGSIICDNAWIEEDLDITALAAGAPSVYLRWVMGPTDGAVAYCGWNIDDVRVVSYPCTPWTCGDLDADGILTAADVIFSVNYVFKSGPAPDPVAAADVNGDGVVAASDVVQMVAHVFKSGPDLACP